VKLIPLSPEEIAAMQADRSEAAHRKMAATCDGYSFIYARRPTTAEELLSEVEIYRNTDFDTLIVHALWGGDKVSYPSKYGTIPGLDMDDFVEVGQRYFVESARELARKNINPVKVLIDGAHDIGMKVHVGVRPAGWSYGGMMNDFWETPFYQRHPEWRCIDRDGAPTTRMSWAVPEVRRHMIDGLLEAVSFGADGANIVFNRGYPVVLYEQPVLDMFQKQYGEDARKLDEEADPRIRKLWSDIVTSVMRGLRGGLPVRPGGPSRATGSQAPAPPCRRALPHGSAAGRGHRLGRQRVMFVPTRARWHRCKLHARQRLRRARGSMSCPPYTSCGCVSKGRLKCRNRCKKRPSAEASRNRPQSSINRTHRLGGMSQGGFLAMRPVHRGFPSRCGFNAFRC
jgi:hypothetical protein